MTVNSTIMVYRPLFLQYILLDRDIWMRFHSSFYQTLTSTPDGRVLGEVTVSHIYDKSPGGASAYIFKCGTPDVAYDLIYKGEGVSLDTTLQLITVNLIRLDNSPALTGHYMVDLLPPFDSPEPRNVLFLRPDK